MAFRSSNYPLTGLGFATGQNSDASSQSSLTDAASGSTPSDVKMTEFIVDNTDGVSGPSSDIFKNDSVSFEQQFLGEGARFGSIKNTEQNFSWSSGDSSVISIDAAQDFTAEGTAAGVGSSICVSGSFDDKYNTTSSVNVGQDCNDVLGCDFTGPSLFSNFDSLGPSIFPEIRAEVTVDNNSYGQDGSLGKENFEVCEDNTTQTIKNINFATGSGSKLDMVVVMDDTGSMDDEIGGLQSSLTGSGGLVQSIENEGFDARYALVSYKDIEEVDFQFAKDDSAFESSINNLSASGGLDDPEDGLDALGVALSLKAPDGNGSQLSGFREDAQKVVIQTTDQESHRPGGNENDVTTITQSDAENKINSENVQYFAVSPDKTSSDSSEIEHKTIALNVENGEHEVIGSADFQSIFDSIVEGVTQASYRLFYDTTNDTADGSTRNVQVKVIPPATSGDDTMVVDRTYTAPSTSLGVKTEPATNIGQEKATLNGSVRILDGTSGEVSFEWGPAGSVTQNQTSTEQVSQNQFFSSSLTSGGSQTLGNSIAGSEAGDQVRPVSWDRLTGRLAAGSLDNNVYIYDQSISLTNTLSDSSGEIRGVAWDPFNGRLAASSSDDSIRIYDGNLNLLQTHTDSTNTATGMDWNPINGDLAVGSQDGNVYVYSGTGGMTLDQTLSPSVGNLFDVGFGHFQGKLAAGGSDGTLAVYDLNSGTYNLNTTITPSSQNVTYVDFDPNQDRFAVSSGDADVDIFDGTTLSNTATLTDSSGSVRGLAWDPVNGRLATASTDNAAYIYDNALNLIQTISNPPDDDAIKVNWDTNTGRLVVSSNDTNTYVFESTGLLDPGTTYDFRAIFEYSGEQANGKVNTFTTNSA